MYRNPPERKGRRCRLRPSTWNTCATGTHLRSSAPGIQAARGGRGEGWPEERLKESSLVNSFPAWNSSSQGQATEPRRATNAAMRLAGRSASTTDSAARTGRARRERRPRQLTPYVGCPQFAKASLGGRARVRSLELQPQPGCGGGGG